MAQAPLQVVWFKRDLRIHDHAPLANAAAAGPVLPLFAIEPGQWQAPDSALRHWKFAADSLVDLAQALDTLGRKRSTNLAVTHKKPAHRQQLTLPDNGRA